MCEICLQAVCLKACPNAPELTLISICAECGGGIFQGDEYYKVGGDNYCEDCICDMRIYTYG